jgi:hypothetical protein
MFCEHFLGGNIAVPMVQPVVRSANIGAHDFVWFVNLKLHALSTGFANLMDHFFSSFFTAVMVRSDFRNDVWRFARSYLASAPMQVDWGGIIFGHGIPSNEALLFRQI